MPTAKAPGLEISPTLLARADEVIVPALQIYFLGREVGGEPQPPPQEEAS